MRKIQRSIFYGLAVCTILLTAACSTKPKNVVKAEALPTIYPDYIGVTVPVEIAPLDFNVVGADRVDVVVKGEQGGEVHANGRYADFDVDQWHELLRQNQGARLSVSVCARTGGQWTQYRDFFIQVSPYELGEWGITYRRILPSYVSYSKMGLYQRSLADFTEKAIIENTAVPGACFNCHTSLRTSPDQFTFHVRGEHGATLVQREGKREWLNTKTEETLGTCVYPYWHPSGRYIAFSTNRTAQAFHAVNDQRIEVFDHASDLQVYDVETHELLLSPLLKQPDWMESYPVFSPDGTMLYFCTSRQYDDIPNNYKKIKYNICRISFDAGTGTFGEQVDTIVNAVADGKSAVHPRPSYDGKYLMYTVCDYGCFPIWHNESDQWLLNLQTGESRPIDEANSSRADSYHNWSLNSRWFVFTSRRDNGLNSLLYLASVDDEGRVSKPFLLPQRDPLHFYDASPWSYNTPDFTLKPVSLDMRRAAREIFSDKRTPLAVRH
ncbi:MAG: PD40 domain-containing protein [Prevotella sp.]|nr:PD40 domain-containing protein [Prevotella sp.]